MTDNLPKPATPRTQEPTRRKDGKYKPRVSAQMQTVIEMMADEGVTLPVAAQRAGITRDAAVKAFNRPHVKAAYNQLVADIRANAAQQAYLRMNKLSQSAESEHVRADANKWVAGVGNIAPLKRVEGKFTHEHKFGGFEMGHYGEGETVDVTPDPDCTSSDQDD